jgi:arylsulfatase A-like enzyme
MRGVSLLVFAASLLALAGCGSTRDRRPDLVLVIVDTWRWDAFGANGAGRPDITPHLDALADGGVRFSRAIASSPWTLPSVASLLTGHYPTVHGAYGRYKALSPIRAQISTLAEMLAAEGYTTAAVINNPFLESHFGFDRGFEAYDYARASNREARRAGPSVDAALALLGEANPERPVFLLLHVFDPHLSYDPPPPWDRRFTGDYAGPLRPPLNLLKQMRSGSFAPSPQDAAYIRALYDGEVGYADRELGRLFRDLDAVRPDRERLIAVTSDHGEEFGEHGGWEHGHTMYREQLQVPLIVVPPASRPPQRRVVEAQIRLLDLFPTLLEAAGLPAPESVPGSSLLPLMEGDAGAFDRPAFSEREHLGEPAAAWRDGSLTLIVYPRQDRFELFDALEDPGEKRDLSGAQAETVRALAERFEAQVSQLERTAEALGPDVGTSEIDPKLLEELRALGYIGE